MNTLLPLFVLQILSLVFSQQCTLLSSLSIAEVGYLTIGPLPGSTELAVFLSSFYFDRHKVFVIRRFEDILENPSLFPSVTVEEYKNDDVFQWPNEISICDVDFCPPYGGLIVSDGFIIPSVSNGNVYYLPFSSPGDVGIDSFFQAIFPKREKTYFTKTIPWVLESKRVFLSAQTKVVSSSLDNSHSLPKVEGTMFILSNFSDPNPRTFDGPEAEFQVVNDVKLPFYSGAAIVAPEFMAGRLSLYTASSWNDTETIRRSILDIGNAFDACLVDANGDGQTDVVASIQKIGAPGSVFAYHYDAPSRIWNRHLLADGFRNLTRPTDNDPGMIVPIFLGNGRRPSFILSGDDGGSLYLLNPASQDPDNWTCELKTVYETKTTVGQPVVFLGSSSTTTPYVLLSDYGENRVLLFKCSSG